MKAGDWCRGVRLAPVVKLMIGERPFKGQLKIDVAKHGLIDVEYDRRWQILRVMLLRHRTPRCVIDVALQIVLRHSIDLSCNRVVFSGVFYPKQAKILVGRVTCNRLVRITCRL